MRTGAFCAKGDKCRFVVWAPHRDEVAVHLTAPKEQTVALERTDHGYWAAELESVPPGTRYKFRLDDEVEWPDPASRSQPDGVHEASEVVDHGEFQWTDTHWEGLPLAQMIMYELHVGTFTPEGTFDAVIPRLKDLKELGINTIELMPVAQFPGGRNWGYDGVYPYAVQNTYGGPEGLKRLVDAAHREGMAMIMDVVYNHLGPEGNYLHEFGPYFTNKFRSPWGWAMNFDGAWSDQVREYFIENALAWFDDYHIDALRLDAIHGIFDMSAKPFLQELAERTDAHAARTGRRCHLIAESDLNDTRVIRPRTSLGFGIPVQWSDDFHHALHTLLTGESRGYYADFGTIEDLVKALRDGFVYDGRYSVYRQRSHGNMSKDLPFEQFVHFSQNHDQVGNRVAGDRMTSLVDYEGLKLAAAAVLLAPQIPMLWMGEEYGEPSPFLYFVSHGDPDLVEAVRKGRADEFTAFDWESEPPDPQAQETFDKSRLDWSLRKQGKHATLLAFYKKLITLRKTIAPLQNLEKTNVAVKGDEDSRIVILRRRQSDDEAALLMSFNEDPVDVEPPLSEGTWLKLLDSSDESWEGPGTTAPDQVRKGDRITMQPWSAVFYRKEAPS